MTDKVTTCGRVAALPAERLSEWAISRGVFWQKTLRSSSSALLLRVTAADHFFDCRRLRSFLRVLPWSLHLPSFCC